MDNNKKRITGLAVLMTAGLFVMYGTVRGEVGVVLNKAVNICFECIGLG